MAKMEKGVQVPLLRYWMLGIGTSFRVGISGWHLGRVRGVKFGLVTSKRLSMHGVGVLILNEYIY